MTQRLVIAELGAQGDGIAVPAGQPVFVPFALPGEDVEVEPGPDGWLLGAVLTASPDRVAPICEHFGTCGGCALQHLAFPAYAEWKRGLVMRALAHRGLEVPVEPVRATPIAGRRRATFALVRDAGAWTLGFHTRAAHTAVAIRNCPVLVPQIERARSPLAALLVRLVEPGKATRVTVTATATGLDVAVVGARARSGPGRMAAAAATAGAVPGLARLTVEHELLWQGVEPELRYGPARVVPPPGGFLQASADVEVVMQQIVTDALAGAKRIADLFCGLGAFALPLARRSEVLAIDSDTTQIAALAKAARSPGLKPLTAIRRDLFAHPLEARELGRLDGVVLDPPRAGASAQAKELAVSPVPVVAAISCAPATLARDLRLLVDGGYRIERVQPIDQFVFTPHIEVVVVLRRK